MESGTIDSQFLAFVLGFAFAGLAAMFIIRMFYKRFSKLFKAFNRGDEQ